MNFFKRALNSFNGNSFSVTPSEFILKKIKNIFISKVALSIVLPVLLFAFLTFLIIVVLTSTFGYNVQLMQLVDYDSSSNNNNSSIGVDLNYNLEEYYNLSQNAIVSAGNPSVDFKGTPIGSVSSFNKHIKDMINSAGFGTRQGVVAAGMALIGDYIKYTSEGKAHGIRPKYINAGRQASDVDGIVDENFFATDCSGFAWWALYNGGFKIPCAAETSAMYGWASGSGLTKSDIKGGQPGDFMVTRGKGHIVLIVGVTDIGYYIAEECTSGSGARINIYPYDYLNANNYAVIDMTNYYNNRSNLRSS